MTGFWYDEYDIRGRLSARVDRPKLKKPPVPRPARSARQREFFCDGIKYQTARLMRDASALSTQTTAGSHWSFWTLFCDWAGIDVDLFASSSEPHHAVLEDEEDALVAFKATVFLYPRTKAKHTKKGTRYGCKTSRYAAQCISTVRTHYEKSIGRVDGLRSSKGQASHRISAVSKGLAKLDPFPAEPRPPLLPQHMLAIRAQCDLVNSQEDRVAWAFCLACWAYCNRLGANFVSVERARLALVKYDPFSHTHRGRVTVKKICDGRLNISFSMITPKQDPRGRYEHQSVFVTGLARDIFNCGNALVGILLKDRAGAGTDLSAISLFRSPRTGKKITKDWQAKWLDRKLKAAGLHEFLGKGQSLRIGGATVLFEMHGEIPVRALVGWASAAMFTYLHLSDEKRMKYAEDMGRTTAVFVPGNHLPIGRRS